VITKTDPDPAPLNPKRVREGVFEVTRERLTALGVFLLEKQSIEDELRSCAKRGAKLAPTASEPQAPSAPAADSSSGTPAHP
jgi:hypothetical protein